MAQLWLSFGFAVAPQWVSERFRAIQSGFRDSMQPHVGLCWDMLAQGAQDRFMSAQVGPETPEMVPEGFPSTP